VPRVDFTATGKTVQHINRTWRAFRRKHRS
jgi:hypothetical protein